MKPGPGAYSPERVYLNKSQAPRFSMGIRHSEFITPLILEVRWLSLQAIQKSNCQLQRDKFLHLSHCP